MSAPGSSNTGNFRTIQAVARILIAGFCAVPGPDRAGVQMRHVLRALAPHHAVDVLALRAGDQPYVERHASARLLRVPLHELTPRARVEAFRRALRRQLDGAEYDIVHVRDGWSGMPVLEERDRLRYGVVFDAARSPMAEPGRVDPDLAAELARDEEACLLAADAILAPHEPGRRYLAARGRADRVYVVPPGVDVDRFDWDVAPEAGPPRVLYAGALAPGCGVRILLRAMVDVARKSDARLVLAGPPAPGFTDVLASAVSDLRLTDRVELLGPIEHEELPALIATATVCVAPAAAELTPRPTALYPTKLLEYLACRRAVVAPRRGTVGLLLVDAMHGLSFTPGDPGDLARKILVLLADAQLRQSLAGAGYELVRSRGTASGTRRALRVAYRAIESLPRVRERLAVADAPAPARRRPVDGVTSEIGSSDLEPATGTVGDATHAIDGPPAGDETYVEMPAAPWSGAPSPDTVAELDASWPPHARVNVRVPQGMRRRRDDEWVAVETGLTPAAPPSPWDDDDDEGTPVDVQAVNTGLTPVESRFIAGELDVPTPAPALTPEADGDDDTVFTAVSVLLGQRPGSGEGAREAGEAEDGGSVEGPGVPPHLRRR